MGTLFCYIACVSYFLKARSNCVSCGHNYRHVVDKTRLKKIVAVDDAPVITISVIVFLVYVSRQNRVQQNDYIKVLYARIGEWKSKSAI